jgi:hypothetical protein
MSEQQPVVLNAVTVINDIPHFELNATEITVRIGANDSDRFLCVHLRPYTTPEMKETLKALKVRVRDMGPSLLQEDGDPSALRRLTDTTFLRLSHVRMPDGSAPSPEVQKAWLDQNPGLKGRIANDAFAQVIQLGRAAGKEKDDVFELLLNDNAHIEARYLIHSLADAEGKPADILVAHHFVPDTEDDLQAYERASRREIDKASGAIAIAMDYDALEPLYDRTIVSVDGLVVDGEPATAYNKAAWIPKVPYWQKLTALNIRFEEVLKKNVA